MFTFEIILENVLSNFLVGKGTFIFLDFGKKITILLIAFIVKKNLKGSGSSLIEFQTLALNMYHNIIYVINRVIFLSLKWFNTKQIYRYTAWLTFQGVQSALEFDSWGEKHFQLGFFPQLGIICHWDWYCLLDVDI